MTDASASQHEGLLDVRDVVKTYPARGRKGDQQAAPALAGVSLTIGRGEAFGLVGESGSGKTTLARTILRLQWPDRGEIRFDGIDLLALDSKRMRALRRRIQVVFQDSTGSLDPRMTVAQIVREPLDVHGEGAPASRLERAKDMLERVGITTSQWDRRPHEFSGGQRQRIAIARALVLSPELVILDEPVSALDVSVQAQVLNLLHQLKVDFDLTYLFVVHDLAVAEHFCDRIGVLYRGHMVELARRQDLFRRPMHPYSHALLSAAETASPGGRPQIALRGDEHEQGTARTGCIFRPRCPLGKEREICARSAPPLTEWAGGHAAACHFAAEIADDPEILVR